MYVCANAGASGAASSAVYFLEKKKRKFGKINDRNRMVIFCFTENNDEYKFVRFGLPTQEKQDDETVTTKSVDNYLFGADGHIDITNGVDHVYQIVIWLHDDNFDQNREQAKNFSGTIKINVKSDDNTENITGTRD